MDLYSSIFKRASTRSFVPSPVSADVLKELVAFIAGVKPLLSGAAFTCRIAGVGEVKGLALPVAPHYLLISGKEQPLRYAAAGFLGQHAELFLYANGLAARWLAVVKPKQKDPNHIIGIAFGKAAQPVTRSPADFKRKPLAEIAHGSDSRLEAARLAPSGMNAQPWYFIADGGKIHVYFKTSLGGLAGKLYNLTALDAGIALAHLAVASEHEGKPFNFAVNSGDAPTPPAGLEYLGTVG